MFVTVTAILLFGEDNEDVCQHLEWVFTNCQLHLLSSEKYTNKTSEHETTDVNNWLIKCLMDNHSPDVKVCFVCSEENMIECSSVQERTSASVTTSIIHIIRKQESWKEIPVVHFLVFGNRMKSWRNNIRLGKYGSGLAKFFSIPEDLPEIMSVLASDSIKSSRVLELYNGGFGHWGKLQKIAKRLNMIFDRSELQRLWGSQNGDNISEPFTLSEVLSVIPPASESEVPLRTLSPNDSDEPFSLRPEDLSHVIPPASENGDVHFIPSDTWPEHSATHSTGLDSVCITL